MLVFDPAVHGSANCLLTNKVFIAAWKGKNSISCMTTKQERISILQRFENIKISDR